MSTAIDASSSGLLDFLSALPSTLYEGLHAFLHEYLGARGAPVPFGGRSGEMDELDRWLADSTTSRALVVAEAGRGKSALLARWAANISMTGMARVAFVPVSIRFHTALASAFARILRTRLASLCGKTLEENAPSLADEIAEIHAILREDQPEDAPPLVVVLDGLDEAVGWMLGRSFNLPETFGRNVKIIASARILSDCDEKGWAARLGWQERATLVPLPRLPATAVREVLVGLGEPLALLEGRVDIVAELHRLSEGDPLLIRLLVDAMRGERENAAMLSPADLVNLRPGLDGFFAQWWEEQRRQWGSAAPLTEPHIRTILHLLASALGPLSAADFDVLAGSKGTTIPRALGRFVIGDGEARGYVFSHPRFAQFLRERMTDDERRHFDEKFVQYGIDIVARLSRGELAPTNVPLYVLQHHVAHLERAGADDAHYYDLIQRGWLEAWEALDDGFGGFLRDLDRAFVLTDRAFSQATTIDLRGEAMARQVRYHEILEHIRQVELQVDEKLWGLLLQDGVWTPAMALERAKAMRYQDRVGLLKLVLPYLPDERLWEIAAMVRDFSHIEGAVVYDWFRVELAARFVAIERFTEAASILEGSGDFWGQGAEAWKLCARLPAELGAPIRKRILLDALEERQPDSDPDPFINSYSFNDLESMRARREVLLDVMEELGDRDAAEKLQACIEAMPKRKEYSAEEYSYSSHREESRCDVLRRFKDFPENERRAAIRKELASLLEETKERKYENLEPWEVLTILLELAENTQGAISHDECATALRAVLDAQYPREREGWWTLRGIDLAKLLPVDLLGPLLKVAWEGLDAWSKYIQSELDRESDRTKFRRFQEHELDAKPLSLIQNIALRLPPSERDEVRRRLVARALSSDLDIWRNGTRNDDLHVDLWWLLFDSADRRAMLIASLRRARRFAKEHWVLPRLVDIAASLDGQTQREVCDEIFGIGRRVKADDTIAPLHTLAKKLPESARAPIIAELRATLARVEGSSWHVERVIMALLHFVSEDEKLILARRECTLVGRYEREVFDEVLAVLPENERYAIADEKIRKWIADDNRSFPALHLKGVSPSTRERLFAQELDAVREEPWDLVELAVFARGDEYDRIARALLEYDEMPPHSQPGWHSRAGLGALPTGISQALFRPLARMLLPVIPDGYDSDETYAAWTERAAILGESEIMRELFGRLRGHDKIAILLSCSLIEEAEAEITQYVSTEGDRSCDFDKLAEKLAGTKHASWLARRVNDDRLASWARLGAWGTLWPSLSPDERETLLPAVERAARQDENLGRGKFGDQIVEAVSHETLAHVWAIRAGASARRQSNWGAYPSFLTTPAADYITLRRLGGERALRSVAAAIAEVNGWFR